MLFFKKPKFWYIVVLSITLIALCQYFGTQTVTNQITGENNLPTPSTTTNPNSFISTWDTSISGPTTSDTNTIDLPLVSGGQYNFNVSWGDGSSDIITSYNDPAVNHTYTSSGIYTVNITGYLKGWNFNFAGDYLKIIGISQWGNINLGNSGSYFFGCSNLVLNATDALNLTGTTNLYDAFAGCPKLGDGSGNINGWNVSGVTNMNTIFGFDNNFNMNIGNWDVSSVTDMSSMFEGDSAFDQSIGNWNVTKVTTMKTMFYGASSFNQDIINWNVSSVTDMSYMFDGASAFNQPIGNWNVSNVQDMSNMFTGDNAFSAENYGSLLIGWSQLNLYHGVTFSAGSTQYPANAAAARQYINNTCLWSITDGGLANPTTPTLNPISSPSITRNVTLEWSSSQFDLNYSVYRSTSTITSLTGAILIASDITVNTYNDTNLAIGTYYYVILASNGATNSSISNCESVSVISIPSEPINLTATAESNSISLTWKAPANNGGSSILYYNIYRSESANGPFTLIGNSTTTSYNDSNVFPGKTYYYEVTVANSAGASYFSNVANATASNNSTTLKSINGMGIGEILSVSFVGVLVVAITMKKRKSA